MLSVVHNDDGEDDHAPASSPVIDELVFTNGELVERPAQEAA
jgi:hypothetical protein